MSNKRKLKPQPVGPLRCAIYCRVSTEEQAKEGTVSIEDQERRCCALAEREGWHVVAVYREEGFTGTVDDRPELGRLLSAARQGEFARVVCLNGGRWFRDALLSRLNRNELEEQGVSLVFVEGDFDRTTDEGGFVGGIMDQFYEFQRKSLLRTMANGARAKLRDGRWPSSNASAPWCFRVEGTKRDARLVPDTGERAIAELAARLLVDEATPPDEVCALLNAQGKLPRPMRRRADGKTVLVPLQWDVHRLRLYLTKESLTGRIVWGGGRFAARLYAGGPLKYGEPVEYQAEPVFTKERFEAIGQALTVFGPREEPERTYPWSGRIASACGKVYVGISRVARGIRAYKCQGKRTRAGESACSCPWLRADEIEERAWRAVVASLGDPEQMMEHARQHLAIQEGRAAGAAEERDELTSQARTRREAMQAHASAMMRAGIEPETMAATMKAEQDEIAAIERRRDDIARFIAEGRQRSDVLDQVARLAEHMSTRLPQLDADGQRLVVATLDLSGEFNNPADPRSEVTITSRNGTGELAVIGLLPDVHGSSTEV